MPDLVVSFFFVEWHNLWGKTLLSFYLILLVLPALPFFAVSSIY